VPLVLPKVDTLFAVFFASIPDRLPEESFLFKPSHPSEESEGGIHMTCGLRYPSTGRVSSVRINQNHLRILVPGKKYPETGGVNFV